ncbi:Smr/MutS family protein [Streptomyces sp. NPDC056161]|uniref:Smr/MutS family protein n=1 Tax=Streptomyces sp. NPDC056161 TaxID=3345732 RepID=UPI0035E19054
MKARSVLRSLDLHPIFRNNRDIDQAVRSFIFNAYNSGDSMAEIIPGKGKQRLKNHVLAYLNQNHMRRFYRRVEADPTNAGRIVVHFK